MKKAVALFFLVAGLVTANLSGQTAASPSATAAKSEKRDAKQKSDTQNPLGLGAPGTNGPTTTEIYSDEAFFDSNKSMGIFTGRVKVADPRFNLQSDKLTVFISKGENQGLEKAVAEGNVGVVRDRPDPNGGPPTRAVGRSDTATYLAATGDVELKGTPRVQQGMNTHIATSADTVMVINQNGQLKTHGPSRTEIKQEPKDMNGESKDDKKAEGNKKSDANKKTDGDKKPEGSTKAEASPKA